MFLPTSSRNEIIWLRYQTVQKGKLMRSYILCVALTSAGIANHSNASATALQTYLRCDIHKLKDGFDINMVKVKGKREINVSSENMAYDITLNAPVRVYSHNVPRFKVYMGEHFNYSIYILNGNAKSIAASIAKARHSSTVKVSRHKWVAIHEKHSKNMDSFRIKRANISVIPLVSGKTGVVCQLPG